MRTYAQSQTNYLGDVKKDAQEVFINLQKKGVIRPQGIPSSE